MITTEPRGGSPRTGRGRCRVGRDRGLGDARPRLKRAAPPFPDGAVSQAARIDPTKCVTSPSRALERRASFRPGGNLRGWLLAVLHNRFIDSRRSQRAGARQAAAASALATAAALSPAGRAWNEGVRAYLRGNRDLVAERAHGFGAQISGDAHVPASRRAAGGRAR